MTSSFDKMLKDYQGSLPDISNTNFLDSDTNYKAVNAAIDQSLKDSAIFTERAVKLSRDLEKNKNDPWKELTGLIKPLGELYKSHIAKQKLNSVIEEYSTVNQNQLPGYVKGLKDKSLSLIHISEPTRPY